MSNELTVTTLVTCRKAVRDPTVGQNLFGVFQTILARRFPFTMPRFDVFVALEGMAAPAELTIALTAEDSATPIVWRKVKADIDPGGGATGKCETSFSDVTFPVPGAHRVRVLSGDRELASRRIHLQTPNTSPEKT